MKKGVIKTEPAEIRDIVYDYIETANYSETARRHNRDYRSIMYIVKNFKEKNPNEYEKMYHTFLQNSEQRFIAKTTSIINSISDKIGEKVQDDDNSIAQLSTSLGILYDKRQLSLGKSTTNSAIVIQMSDDIKDLAK